jgi:hypothetical protein
MKEDEELGLYIEQIKEQEDYDRSYQPISLSDVDKETI